MKKRGELFYSCKHDIHIFANGKIKLQNQTIYMLNTYMCGTLPTWYQPFIPLTVLPLGMNTQNYMQVLSTLDVTHVRKDSRLFTNF